MAEIEEAEKQKMRNKCKKIIDHGVNVFVNRQLIYNFAEQVRQLLAARQKKKASGATRSAKPTRHAHNRAAASTFPAFFCV